MDEIIKRLRRQLDADRIAAKRCRKSYDHAQEQFYNGRIAGCETAIDLITWEAKHHDV